MAKFNHLNIEQRKLIASFLSKKFLLCEMADLLSLDPSSVSKEIKRNRVITKLSNHTDKVCKLITRFPYCCNGCLKKYNACPFTQFRYDPKKAQSLADFRLVNSRIGLNMSHDEFVELNKTIKDGVDDKKSIYHIVKDNPQLDVSVSTVYRLINDKKLSTSRMDLPYAVSYKKRKSNKQYQYNENNKIDRSNRTYVDFLAHKLANHNKFHIQLDFLGAIKTDKKNILTLTIPSLHYVMLFIIESPNTIKVVNIFNYIEQVLSTKTFFEVFPYILTDRDPNFSNFLLFETSNITNEQRTFMFYCDSFASSQKGNVEQMNKQLRKFFKKGKSIDHLTNIEVKDIETTINNTRVQSLSGASPKEAFIKVYGLDVYNKLVSIII
jgi:Transposase and inactivated derivatives, IS30 family